MIKKYATTEAYEVDGIISIYESEFIGSSKTSAYEEIKNGILFLHDANSKNGDTLVIHNLNKL